MAGSGEVYFPRGGANVLTPLELRRIQQKATRDFLFESQDTKKNKKRKREGEGKEEIKEKAKENAADSIEENFVDNKGRRRPKTEREKQEEQLESLITAHLPKEAVSVSPKNLYVGMTLLGAVRKLKDMEMVVSLPNNMNGIISLAEVSTHLSNLLQRQLRTAEAEGTELDGANLSTLRDFFTEGQILRCSVLRINEREGKKRIALTLDPAVLNSGLTLDTIVPKVPIYGTIQSVEDHGYVVYFGHDSYTGFLLKSDVVIKKHAKPAKREKEGDEEEEEEEEENDAMEEDEDTATKELVVGQPVYCIVKTVRDKTVQVRMDEGAFSHTFTKENDVATIHSLKAGQMVHAVVKKRLKGGVAVEFLGIFTGTITATHLACINLADLSQYKEGTKLTARILWVNVNQKRVGLTALPHIVKMRPYDFPKGTDIGDFLENAVVKRVQPKHGIFLAIDKENHWAFAHISRISDKEIKNLSNEYPLGKEVKCRVIGHNPLEGLVNVSTSNSILKQAFLQLKDVEVGSFVKGKVVAVLDSGVLLSFRSDIKGLIPKSHLADIIVTDPARRFPIGESVKCRVLNVDADENKLILTHKSSLMTSPYPIVTKYQDVAKDTVTHATIVAVKPFGVFVQFYNGVKGLVHTNEVGIPEGSTIEEAAPIGQTKKCRIISSDPEKERITASFLMAGQLKASEQKQKVLDTIKTGDFISARVISVNDSALTVKIRGELISRIMDYHLSDHQAHWEALLKAYKPNQKIRDILVLEKKERKLTLTLKPSLVKAARVGRLPGSSDSIKPGMTIPGFIRSITQYGCFVGFLGNFNALAHRKHLLDRGVLVKVGNEPVDPIAKFVVGQSVTAYVREIDAEARVNVGLQQSHCMSRDAAFLHTFFEETEVLSNQNEANGDADAAQPDWSRYTVGAIVDATALVLKEIGAIFTLPDQRIKGFALATQIKDVKLKEGQTVKACVLDVDKQRSIVDLSLLPEFLPKSASESQAAQGPADLAHLKPDSNAECRIEVVKASYLIVSLPPPPADANKAGNRRRSKGKQPAEAAETSQRRLLAFAATKDYNTQNSLDPFATYPIGETRKCVILTVPSRELQGRLIVRIVAEQKEDKDTDQSQYNNGLSSVDEAYPGLVVKGKVTKIDRALMSVSLGSGVRGRLHMSKVNDSQSVDMESVFSAYKKGDIITAKVLGIRHVNKGEDSVGPAHSVLDLTVRPKDLSLPPGQLAEDDKDTKKTADGNNVAKKRLQPLNDAADLAEGKVVRGRILKVQRPMSLYVELAAQARGRVHITDIYDDFTDDPLSDFEEDQVVEVYILKAEDNFYELSMRASRVIQGVSVAPILSYPEITSVDSVKEGALVQGYVKAIGSKGCFVALSRNVVALVKLCELRNGFVPEPEKEFPIGRRVIGRVIDITTEAADSKRIELSLRQPVVKKLLTFDDFKVGMKVKGYVKNVAAYGIFVWLKYTRGLHGMCHVSEVSDTYVDAKDLSKLFTPGDYVTAKVVLVDKKRKRISLSLKPSNFAGEDLSEDSDAEEMAEKKRKRQLAKLEKSKKEDEGQEVTPKRKRARVEKQKEEESEEEEEEEQDNEEGGKKKGKDKILLFTDKKDKKKDKNKKKNDKLLLKAMDEDSDDEESEEEEESFGTLDVAPIPLSLQNGNKKDKEESSELVNEEDMDIDGKGRKRNKALLKAQQEAALAQREIALADSEVLPESADDFEKLLLSQANSSYVWIQYIAFQLSLAEVDKARAIGERALKTINYRDESEKMNVWVAMMNLENTYGTPESLNALVQRAVQFTDQRSLYNHLIDIYVRSKNYPGAEQIHKKLCQNPAFKAKASVWIHYAQFLASCIHEMERARGTLKRALQVLPKKKHIKMITKWGQLEFKEGFAERGRTIFDGILASYPKRVDIWSIYMDMENKYGTPDSIRKLYEIITSLNLSSKKMSFFLKRWMTYEKANGTSENIKHVKEKTQQYLIAKANQ